MFFDEMNQAPQIVLGAALSLVLNGKIGSYILPENWIVVAAGNREIDLGDAPPTPMSSALSNRFAHINYAPTVEGWIKWALTREEINPDIIAFLKHKPEYFHKLDDEDSDESWPSPRSWHLASEEEYDERGRSWDKTRISKDIWDEIYVPRVGAQAAAAFGAYLALKTVYNERDVEGVYKNGAKAKRLPKRADESYAASASIASYKAGQKLTEKEVKNLTEFLSSIPEIEKRTPIMSQAKDFHPELKEDPKLSKTWWDGIKVWHTDLKKLDDDSK